MNEKKLEKMLGIAGSYALDGCYEASERQYQLACQTMLKAFSSEKNLTLPKALEYQKLARLLQGS